MAESPGGADGNGGREPDGPEGCPSEVGASAAAKWIEPVGLRAASSVRPEEDPDQELVARWRAGDPGSFEELIRRHEARVYRFLLRMLGDPAEAEDVAQETFLNLHRNGLRFRGEARFSTFVYRVAANGALNRRRGLGRLGARHRKLAEHQAAGDHLPSGPRDPESAAAGAQIGRLVQAALVEVPETLRLPLILFDIEGLSYSEIARAISAPEGTVKSRIHRARKLLREHLAPVLELEDPS
jgi:RNA polymerase sigma-70 factor (ECF subfamily)